MFQSPPTSYVLTWKQPACSGDSCPKPRCSPRCWWELTYVLRLGDLEPARPLGFQTDRLFAYGKHQFRGDNHYRKSYRNPSRYTRCTSVCFIVNEEKSQLWWIQSWWIVYSIPISCWSTRSMCFGLQIPTCKVATIHQSQKEAQKIQAVSIPWTITFLHEVQEKTPIQSH